MSESEDHPEILWRVHLQSPPELVFRLLSTDEGRASFWAESAVQEGDQILFLFPNGERLRSALLDSRSPERFVMTYFNGSVLTFQLQRAAGGTDLTFSETGVPQEELVENRAGWVSVLLNLKARADYGIDLRNHDRHRTWAEGYVDN